MSKNTLVMKDRFGAVDGETTERSWIKMIMMMVTSMAIMLTMDSMDTTNTMMSETKIEMLEVSCGHRCWWRSHDELTENFPSNERALQAENPQVRGAALKIPCTVAST